MRIMVSARDTGAARHLAEIVPYLCAAADTEITVVADQPAWLVLNEAGLAPLRFPEAAVDDDDMSQAGALRKAARDLLSLHRPDAILVGLSGPRIGLDEALLAEANNIATYALQDYPGWVVPGFGVTAQTYFVLDDFAAQLTRKRLDQAAIVVAGSAKHASYALLDIEAIRKKARQAFDPGRPIIGFYGQPAWFLDGYERSINALAAAIALRAPYGQIFYRPHPKETRAELTRMQDIFAAHQIALQRDPNHKAEVSLCAADVVVTCFSSCGADHIHLQKQARQPIGTVLYLLTEPAIRQHHAHDTGIDHPPFATAGFALLSTSPEALSDDLRHSLDPATADMLWKQIHSKLPSPSGAADVILATLHADYAERTKRPENVKGNTTVKDILKGNFQTKTKVVVEPDKKDTLEEKFEKAAKARLGGSVAYVAKKRVVWGDDGKKGGS
ncbi:hypothetical protein [Ferrovibrio terrae]|uniref:hypothetical protein n=1 Tax=Ferrovibrio terrae TaxID=2594003 RepID=UPI003137A568